MSKYNVGDVVKLRDDLKDLDWKWEKLKNIPLLINDKCEINGNGRYLVDEEWLLWASDKMIEGLWEECNQVKKYNEHTLDAWRYAVESKLSEQVSKLKLIDVLNMIAKGELKEGTKVKVRENMYSFNDNDLKREDDEDFVITVFEENTFAVLDIEVELIEPPCEHEWENYETHRIGEGIIRKGRRCKKCGLEEVTEQRISDEGKTLEPTKIKELNLSMDNGKGTGHMFTRLAEETIVNKLNEVIRKINKE